MQTLVTGRIVNNSGQLTISAELVNGRDSTAMWRGSYTPSAANVMDVEHIREGVELHVRETAIELVLQTDGSRHGELILDAIRAEGFAARPER